MFRKLAFLVTTSITTVAGGAAAHPGHGKDGGSYGIIHHLTEPIHIAIGVLLIVFGVVGYRVVKRAEKQAGRAGLPKLSSQISEGGTVGSVPGHAHGKKRIPENAAGKLRSC